jgi:CRISPR type III-B/RAMP module RAMP protein Cmr6
VPDVPRPGPRPGRGPAITVVSAAGPIGSLIELTKRDGKAEPWRLGGKAKLGTGSSPLVVLNRVAFFDPGNGKLHDGGKQELVRWACNHQLGQDARLISHVAARREAALRGLSARHHVVRLVAEPEWCLAVGLGSTANAHEISLALHGTYGWPVLPGSALKGLTAAWAVASGTVKADDIGRVLGTPRLDVATERDAARGSVSFLDGIPAGQVVAVEPDVLTPHVKPYYDGVATGKPVPPAEYHNPVPLIFLTVRGSFFVDLHGSNRDDTEMAADWLRQAGDELGAGAKTAAGYGYLRVQRREKALA